MLSIEGNQADGWSSSDSEHSRKILFNFEVEGLENDGGFLLLAYSDNEEIYADTWHQSVDEAMKVAEDEYEISKNLWKKVK